MPSGRFSLPSPNRKPMLAATDTMNSAALTEPTVRRGSSLPLLSSVEVATGPQPPPPVASMKPATRPSGPRNFRPGGPPSRPAPSRCANRTRM